MESCKKRALLIGGVFLVIALVVLIAGVALTNSSSSGSGSGTEVGPCKLPKDVGICEGHQPSWYFDGQTGDCEQFVYGGCGGNENRFSSKEECRDVCISPVARILLAKPGEIS